MNKSIVISLFVVLGLNNCSFNKKVKNEEISLKSSYVENSDNINQKAAKSRPIRPNKVLLTAFSSHRLVTLYKEKLSGNGENAYVDGNYYYNSHPEEFNVNGNSWHYHYLPGLEAVYGYNMFNIAHYDIDKKEKQLFFENSVIINTLYYPSFIQDTLNGKPIERNYYLVTVYDEDTNKDSTINTNDLRRLYCFNLDATERTPLIPSNYSVLSSEYDPQNDLMYLYAKYDENANGMRDTDEPIHVFSLNLKSPKLADRLY